MLFSPFKLIVTRVFYLMLSNTTVEIYYINGNVVWEIFSLIHV